MWIGEELWDLEKIAYTYDANNNLISELSERWTGIAWENNSRRFIITMLTTIC